MDSRSSGTAVGADARDRQAVDPAAAQLEQSDIDAAGGLQNAVSAACSETFEAFKAEAAAGAWVRYEAEVRGAAREAR